MFRITVVGPYSIFLFDSIGTDARKEEDEINAGISGGSETLNPPFADCFLGYEFFLVSF